MCSVCYGAHPNCPCCEEPVEMTTCAECDGIGHLYYNEDNDVITEDGYYQLPDDERFVEKCPCCMGEGEVQVEYDHYSNY